jgi:hypothetical protein
MKKFLSINSKEYLGLTFFINLKINLPYNLSLNLLFTGISNGTSHLGTVINTIFGLRGMDFDIGAKSKSLILGEKG